MSRQSPSIALLGLMLTACSQGMVVQEFGGPTMGSTYEVKFVADVPLAEVRRLVEAELAAFDRTFSRWREDSEIVAFNRQPGTEPFRASALFRGVLQQALDVAAATEGAFDPTVAPLSDLYRAAKADPQHRYDEAAARAALPRVGFAKVGVAGDCVTRAGPGVALDLDGIVAGAAADAIAARLIERGVRSFYLSITGEVVCRGEKAPGAPWRIGVVDPQQARPGAEVPVRTLDLRDRALCTSGDYRNAMVAGGKVRHHVFDPRSGVATDNGVVSASVLAASAAWADAVGTAFMVLGPDGAHRVWKRLRERGELGALFLIAADDGSLRQVELEWPR